MQPSVAVVHVKPPGEDVAVYDVTGEPPSEAGALQVRLTELFPAVAEFNVGAPGTDNPVVGVAESAFEAGPVPTAFVAVTVNE